MPSACLLSAGVSVSGLPAGLSIPGVTLPGLSPPLTSPVEAAGALHSAAVAQSMASAMLPGLGAAPNAAPPAGPPPTTSFLQVCGCWITSRPIRHLTCESVLLSSCVGIHDLCGSGSKGKGLETGCLLHGRAACALTRVRVFFLCMCLAWYGCVDDEGKFGIK